ncbi:T6SS effector BTH_I2691 family protein [Pseudomonas sp. RA_105y_Pfl2_P56]|uniref:T6SS effector BTH_I2691 family protein n=2 Tax=unclassified Pseudomonas TaxID=196821 RepID=UPI0030DDB578
MTQPATEAQLKQANRNQAFTNAQMGSGQCSLMAGEVAIFPVRYAVDESPKKGTNQGPNPLPKDWTGKPTELKTRSYTLRQLRDGWLYVWDSVAKTFHEYEVKGHQFTRHKWADGQLNKDVRNNPGETHTYLLYPRRNQLRIAYSPVQWTWRMCELMRSSATQQTQWMRKVNLDGFCSSGKAGHGGPITELGKSVADILAAGESAPTFLSTLLPTQAPEKGGEFKPAFEEALVRGKVPEQDTALFIALDDPLGMVDDLTMNLAGRLMEQGQFESLHQQKLESAIAVQRLCGFDTNAFTPDSIKDPIKRQEYADDLYGLLGTNDEMERGKDLVSGDQAAMVEIGSASATTAAQAKFKAKWGNLPDQKKWQAALEEWNAKRYWREDVRFDEVQKYLSKTTTEAQRLQDHCKRSEHDLVKWLDQLGPSAEEVFHDTADEEQACLLLETAHALYTVLANGEKGQEWLCKQAERPKTLFGMALFNFNPEVANLIKQVTHNFSTTGNLDDQGRESDGSAATLTPTSASDATNIATRIAEIKAVLDLEVVKNSKLYKAMSDAAKQSMTTLIKVANNKAKDAWHGLSILLLPAMKKEIALTLAIPQVLISTEISSATQLAFNPTYQREYQAWQMKLITLNNKMSDAKGVLSRPGAAHDQRSARISMQAFEEELKNLFLARPNQLVAKASGSTRLSAGVPKINNWLADLGRSELASQLRTAGTMEYVTSTKNWMGQNLGNALPALLVGLNVWNVYTIAKQAQNDGDFTKAEWRNFGSAAAYAANAIAALWVGPAWSRAGAMSLEVGEKTLKLAQASYLQWIDEAKTVIKTSGIGSAEATAANKMATYSKGLIFRTVTWAFFGAVATGVEAFQISEDVGDASSQEEKLLLWSKFGVVLGMSLVASGQLVGASLGYWFGFAWVMSNPVTIILAILGIAYLMITMAANRYKREGLRLWLYRCNWGRGATPEWLGDEGHSKQMQDLLETLQRPSLGGRALYFGGGSTPKKCLGFWVQILFPKALAGKEVMLQPVMIEKNYLSSDEIQITSKNFYEQFLSGNWIDPKLFGELPSGAGLKSRPSDFIYTEDEQHCLWQVWIDTPKANPVLEMGVKYPPGTFQHKSGNAYLFRIALEWAASEANRINEKFSGELKEKDDMIPSSKSAEPLKLSIPNYTLKESKNA